MSSATETLVMSGCTSKAIKDLFMPLPVLLLYFVSCCMRLLCWLLRRLLFGDSKLA